MLLFLQYVPKYSVSRACLMHSLHWWNSQSSDHSTDISLWHLLSQCCNTSPQQLDISVALAATSLLVLIVIGCGAANSRYSLTKRIWKFIVSFNCTSPSVSVALRRIGAVHLKLTAAMRPYSSPFPPWRMLYISLSTIFHRLKLFTNNTR